MASLACLTKSWPPAGVSRILMPSPSGLHTSSPTSSMFGGAMPALFVSHLPRQTTTARLGKPSVPIHSEKSLDENMSQERKLHPSRSTLTLPQRCLRLFLLQTPLNRYRLSGTSFPEQEWFLQCLPLTRTVGRCRVTTSTDGLPWELDRQPRHVQSCWPTPFNR